MWKVEELRNGKMRYVNEKGERSENFAWCSHYQDGFAVVRKKFRNYQFRDENGKLSEEFFNCFDYEDGFAVIRKHRGDVDQYRDLLGNVTNEKTQLGSDVYALYTGEKTVFDICDECFLDPKAINVEELPNGKTRLTGFIAKVLQREYERCIQATGGKNADFNAQIEQTKQYFRECRVYCADKMEQVRSDYYEKEQRKIEGNTAINSALQEDILTF